MPMRANCLMMLSLFFALCGPSLTAQAQMSPFNNGFEGTLNGDDINALMAAGQRLYGQTKVPNGATTTWSNPSTGNRGSITVLRSFARQGMQCRQVKYDNHVVNLNGTRSYTLNWCKTPKGEWKIA